MRNLGNATLIAAAASMVAALQPAGVMADFNSGNSIIENCRSRDQYCMGYVAALVDAMGANRVICPPSTVTQGQTMAIFSKYLDDHPEELHQSATYIAVVAFTDAFPC